MKYTMTTPCDACPFLMEYKFGYTLKRLKEFASGEFPCHKTAEISKSGNFETIEKSVHCAGALIFLEKRKQPHQMMRICERLGLYDYKQLDMKAPVR